MYGVLSRVPAPVEMYDAVHEQLHQRWDGKANGLLVHVGRATDEGFEVIEVWESKEHFERYTREVIWPIMAELVPGPPPTPGQGIDEFEVRGLVLPSADLYV
jgi:hypothetical protein